MRATRLGRLACTLVRVALGMSLGACGSEEDTWSLSGTVTGAVSQGVTVTLSGAGSGSTTTNASGTYTFSGLGDGSYTVTPSLSGYTFDPPSLTVSVSGGDVVGLDFVASGVTYAISGTVLGAVSQGVNVTLSGAGSASTTTDASGHYTFGGLAAGSYTVTPTLPGYTFVPESRSVTLTTADVSGQDFTAFWVTPGVCIGDVTITNAAEYAAFADRECESVTGALTIATQDLTSISLPALVTVHSLDIVRNAALNSVSLPGLATVTGERSCIPGTMFCGGGLNISGNEMLTSLSLPLLAAIDGGRISGNPALPVVHLPSLTTVTKIRLCYGVTTGICDGGLEFLGNSSMTSLGLPSLASGGIGIDENAALASVNLPALTTGGLKITSNDTLQSVTAPELSTADGAASAGDFGVHIWRNGALESVSLPALALVGSLRVWHNASLPSLNLPALTTANDLAVDGNAALTSLVLPALASVLLWFDVIDNPLLPQCQAENLVAQMTTPPPFVTISGNDTTAICP